MQPTGLGHSVNSMDSRAPSRLLTLAFSARETLRRPLCRRPTAPGRILVAHHLILGDTLMLTPLLAKLRRQYPESEIVMTVPKAMFSLYRHRPYGVQAFPYDPRDATTLLALRKVRGFDLAFVPGDNRFSWLARAAGARWTVAFAGDRPAYKSWPVDELIPYPETPAAWGDMVAGLVRGEPPSPYDAGQWKAPNFHPFELPQSPYCVLHVGTSSPLKLWKPENWKALATRLRESGCHVAWSAGPGEEDYVAAIDERAEYPSYAGTLDLPQLWHLLANARLLVCPDTGVAHLGRIVGTPTVTLFGPGSSVICGAGNFWRNSRYEAVTVEDFPCRDQHVLFKRDIDWVRRCGRTLRQCSKPLCMERIGVDQVWEAICKAAPGLNR